MRNLIDRVLEASDLTILDLPNNLQLAYYEDKDDFFIIMHSSYGELLEFTNENLKDIQYTLNSMVADLKKSNDFLNLQDRNIKQNLSLILFLEHEEDILRGNQELNKAEENYINAKKYILPYTCNDASTLIAKIGDAEHIIKSLNDLAVSHSELIEETSATWYDLLMNLFIKIPFLNYQPQDNEQAITNLAEMIKESLSPRQSNLLAIIDTNDIVDISDIETFVTNNMLT